MKKVIFTLLILSFCVCAFTPSDANAWKILYTNNDGKLEKAYIECDNGKQFVLFRWIYKGANKYQRLWVIDSHGSNITVYESQKCEGNRGHYDLGAKASRMCRCLGSK
ncbi:MAG: hypothetical protein U9R21_02685 [Candidatus Thermoplasmatota archaeon]|nr:hypothetical protein [Candidatus Thermoplasmatota archaeon]